MPRRLLHDALSFFYFQKLESVLYLPATHILSMVISFSQGGLQGVALDLILAKIPFLRMFTGKIRRSASDVIEAGVSSQRLQNTLELSGDTRITNQMMGDVVSQTQRADDALNAIEESSKASNVDNVVVPNPPRQWSWAANKKSTQLPTRGWTPASIQDVLDNPAEVLPAPRGNLRTGNPATIYYRSDGHYIVLDDITNDIVQGSNLNDPNWVDEFGHIIRPR